MVEPEPPVVVEPEPPVVVEPEPPVVVEPEPPVVVEPEVVVEDPPTPTPPTPTPPTPTPPTPEPVEDDLTGTYHKNSNVKIEVEKEGDDFKVTVKVSSEGDGNYKTVPNKEGKETITEDELKEIIKDNGFKK